MDKRKAVDPLIILSALAVITSFVACVHLTPTPPPSPSLDQQQIQKMQSDPKFLGGIAVAQNVLAHLNATQPATTPSKN